VDDEERREQSRKYCAGHRDDKVNFPEIMKRLITCRKTWEVGSNFILGKP